MSKNYNTTLQTNNSSLEEIITQLNNMPDADGADWDAGSYIIEDVSGASYGFSLNSNGYYESENKGIKSSAALCKVIFTSDGVTPFTLECINYAESSYDYGLLSNIDTTFSTSSAADTSNVFKSFKSLQSASVVTVDYGVVSAGEHYIYVKFIKDSSQDSNNDSLQFKIVSPTSIKNSIVNAIENKGVDVPNDVKLEDVAGFIDDIDVNDGSVEDSIIMRTISSYTNDRVTTIGADAFSGCPYLTSVSFHNCSSIKNNAFEMCQNLTTVNFPNCTSIDFSAFYKCGKLTSVSFPLCTSIGASAFYSCSGLTSVNFPLCASVGTQAFYDCQKLSVVDFSTCKYIGSKAFYYCYKLKSLYLRGSSLCTLASSAAFSYTPIGGYSANAGTYGSIYVPASLLTSYQAAANWSYFSSRFVGI